MIPDESELHCRRHASSRASSYGFFTDTTVCIGCKACEVACKEWNNLPADNLGLTGAELTTTPAHSRPTPGGTSPSSRSPAPARAAACATATRSRIQSGWLMMSDVCKHCHNAPCLEVCPTGRDLFKTEFDTVVVQQDICNGCGYCVPACPFGVVAVSENDGKAHKCTLCYDRLKGGLEPACSKACPTDSIQFGELGDLQTRAAERVERLHGQGVGSAYLYGTPGAPGATGGLGHLNAFFLLTDRPEAYNFPVAPTRASNRVAPSLFSGLLAVAALATAASLILSRRDR